MVSFQGTQPFLSSYLDCLTKANLQREVSTTGANKSIATRLTSPWTSI